MTAAATTTTKSPTLECRDPATGERLGAVPVMDRAEVVRHVERARAAQHAWAATSFRERRAVLRALLAGVLERQDDLCRAAVRDSGKTMVDAAMGEVFPVCEKLRYTIRHGARDLRPERRKPGFLLHKTARVVYQPLGVIGVIAPWNFPFHNLMCPLIPALFAGNAVVTKVSELASWSAREYLEFVRGVLVSRGHSPELVQVVTGYGETGSALVTSGVDKVFFTGSPQNGRKVMAAAAETLTPVVLELGGKDPMIVCEDADLDRALDAAMLGVFTACGQMCVGAERLYVHARVHDEFVRRAHARVQALRQGPPLAGSPGSVDLGAMTMARQLDIIQALVDDAVAKGATLVTGGRCSQTLAGAGQYYEPTILTGVDHSMRITQEEQFGPVMVIVKTESDDEAVRLANDCPYGLGSSVFSRDLARANRIALSIRAGMAVVNDYGLAYMMQDLPFGGVRISGMGRINGREGLRACCNTKAVVSDRVPAGKSVAFHPVREATLPLIQGAIRAIYGKGARRRVGGARAIVRSLARLRRESSE